MKNILFGMSFIDGFSVYWISKRKNHILTPPGHTTYLNMKFDKVIYKHSKITYKNWLSRLK